MGQGLREVADEPSSPWIVPLPNAVHVEYFHDHVRIENLLFDGAEKPKDGELAPELSRPWTRHCRRAGNHLCGFRERILPARLTFRAAALLRT